MWDKKHCRAWVSRGRAAYVLSMLGKALTLPGMGLARAVCALRLFSICCTGSLDEGFR